MVACALIILSQVKRKSTSNSYFELFSSQTIFHQFIRHQGCHCPKSYTGMHCEYMTVNNLQTASQVQIKGAKDNGTEAKMGVSTIIVLTFFTGLFAFASVSMLVMIIHTSRNSRNIGAPDEINQIPRGATGAAKTRASHNLNLDYMNEDWKTKTDDETHFSIDGVEMEDAPDENRIV